MFLQALLWNSVFFTQTVGGKLFSHILLSVVGGQGLPSSEWWTVCPARDSSTLGLSQAPPPPLSGTVCTTVDNVY